MEEVSIPQAAVGLLVVQVSHHEPLRPPATVGHQNDLPLFPWLGKGAVLFQQLYMVLGKNFPHRPLLPAQGLGGCGD